MFSRHLKSDAMLHKYILRVIQNTKLEEFLKMGMTFEIGLFAKMPYV